MTATVPVRLSSALADRYRIERELGAGGMATVYLAHDLRHDRDVAIKVLHEDLGATLGPERFLAEIKTTAKLQHPHILPLLDSGEADGLLFYVMPFVTGETLRERLTRDTQLSIDDAVRIAREVADALGAAHAHGIIHRDVKPENILLQSGHALVADFGIALAVQHAGGARMTQTGLSLGTPQYMSPEQAMGEKSVDLRADIYALGAVTYEMLTGDPPFTGSSVQAIVAKVLSAEPERPTLIRKTIPPGVEAAVLTALAKLPADRFASAGEFAAALSNPAATMSRAGVPAAPARGPRGWLITAAVGAAALVAGLMLGARRTSEPGSVRSTETVHASFALGDSAAVRAIGNLRLAISPNGRRIVYVGVDGAGSSLWIREFDQSVPRRLQDTKDAFAPFFSPDGESIGFFAPAGSGRGAALKVTPLTGGVTRTVVQDSVAPYGGGDWGDDGQIYFTDAKRGLARVASSGGVITKLSHPDTAHGAQEHDYPNVLPGSRLAIVGVWKGSTSGNRIGVIDLRTGVVTDLMAGTYARYTSGYLAVGTAEGKVLVAPFDVRSGRVVGALVPMLQNVEMEANNGTVQFAVSESGVVVYQQMTGAGPSLVWVDRSGHQVPVDSTLTDVSTFALSPDGTEIAVARPTSGDNQVWVKKLTTGSLSRLSFDVANADRPVWTPDGRRVAFLGARNGRRTAWVRRADGSDNVVPASPGDTRLDEIALDPLGRYTLLRTEGIGVGSRHLLVVKNGVDTVPRTLIQSRFDNFAVTLSPNGQWLAYASNESGNSEVYVRPFPNVDSARVVVSAGGGMEPVWRRDGNELFFRGAHGEMFAVPVSTTRGFVSGTPRLLFRANTLAMQDNFRRYDVHPDGKRFLMVTSGGVDASHLDVIFNWRVELARVKQSP